MTEANKDRDTLETFSMIGAGPAPRPKRPWYRTRAALGWAYAAPVTIFTVVMFIVPLFTVGWMSFSDWTLLGGEQGLNGVDNYSSIVEDPLLWPSVIFTLRYTLIVTVIALGLALAFALIVQESSRWNSFLRTVILVPSALGVASASLLFFGLYSPNIGPLSPMLEFFGIIDEPISFLGTPDAALWSTVFLVVWRFTGFYMLILMVGLQGIPGDIYEAASLDGSSRWQTFWNITLPLLRPSFALALILSVTGSLLAFDQFYLLTRGGPDNSTITVVQLIYREAFQRFDLGAAAALSVVVLIGLVLINTAQFRIIRKKD